MRPPEPRALSGRFLLRLPAPAHVRLHVAARNHGLSLNQYCGRRLAVPGPALLMDEGAAAAIDHARARFSERLVGVLVFGSYARGDQAATSDVDVLVVIDGSARLTRTLYREWDVDPPTWADRTIDPHFVHLPADARTMPGAWCEAAIDGVVLLERNGALTRHLAVVRGDIATGRLVRRSAHGQPYWTVAA